ncbi:non-ribosomal peptide synthetase [Paenibacillus sedimenti]|uniref:Non-ribosomal peptide synthase/polyketide synthase n=1 Tax=Paenibacillus sedimenti TaxID=2770274 RepID=A0A926KK25_9BACL|nr:non-ribosomal peptide synthase/polyketide synthase [Paenibacillus sedimenti]MBD0378727.1 non-ribosomal peptide synthase/polyketide synthase [Paenibacillus sedimenti]
MSNQPTHPLTHAQKRIWYTEKFYPGTSISNLGGTFNLKDENLNYGLLNQAILEFVRLNDSIRLRVQDEHSSEPRQYIASFTPFEIPFYDFSGQDDADSKVRGWGEKGMMQPFQLHDADLFEFAIFKISDVEGRVYVKIHHLISDGISMVLAVNEIIDIYVGLVNGEDSIQDKPMSYVDYVRSEPEYEASDRYLKDQKFWHEEFQSIPEFTSLKTYDLYRVSTEAARESLIISPTLRDEITGFCKEHNVSVFTLFVAMLFTYIYRVTSYEDIVLGTNFSNRTNAKEKNMLGMFVSTTPFRMLVEPELDALSFIRKVGKKQMNIFRYQKYPYNVLVGDLREKHSDISRLFGVFVEYQVMEWQKKDGIEYVTEPFGNGDEANDFIIHIKDRMDIDQLQLDIDYRTGLFTSEEISAMLEHMLMLLKDVLENPGKPLFALEFCTEQEKHRLLHQLSGIDADYPIEQTIHGMFEIQAERVPDRIAVSFGSESLTYRELNERSNRLARMLRDYGVKPDDRVGLMVDRTVEMFVGILAILKAGGAYVPLDPDYPEERIQFMLEDSGALLLLTEVQWQEKVPFTGIVLVIDMDRLSYGDSSNLPVVNQPSDMAYIIYTSGTTGKPKGVMIEHRNVVRLLINDKLQFNFSDNDAWTLFHSFSFDFSVWEMYGALLYGGKCVVIPRIIAQNPKEFVQLLRQEKVTVLNQTPTAFYALINEELQQEDSELSIRYVIFGGEALNPMMLKPWRNKYPETKLINMYGITETTVHVTFKEIGEKEIETNVSNIGTPIPTLTCYIFDQNRNLVPMGVVGEMYVGGAGVARGYLNRDELTQDRFIMNPYKPGERLYKSGDLAKMLPNGEMEYLGRIDNQVKIRGHRIEIGEIETRLLQHPMIHEVTVIALEDAQAQKYLCAYLVSDTELMVSELRMHLGLELPAYMIPSHFVQLDKMPITGNGKIDRRALPKPTGAAVTGREYMPPSTETEEKLVMIWQDILEQERIGVQDNFFELGGHSLKAMQIISRVHQLLSVELPLRVLFETPTITEISLYIDQATKETYTSILPAEQQEYYPLSSSQKRLYVLNQFEGTGTTYNMPGVFTVEGPLDPSRLEAAFNRLAARHDMLRTSFHTIDGNPVQKVHDHVDFTIQHYDHGANDSIEDLVSKFVRSFELDQAPLIRIGLAQIDEHRHLFLFDMHHIISDALSIEILIDELAALYRGMEPAAKPVSYKDFAVWQHDAFQSGALKKQEAYWLEAFAGDIPVLGMPADFPRPAVQSFEGDSILFGTGQQLMIRLNQLAAETGTTMYMLLLAAYNVLLAKYGNQNDIVVGTPVAGRSHPDVQHTIGMFVSTLALRNRPTADLSFRAFLEEVKRNALLAFEHQDYPFESLVEKLDVARDMSRNPLFDTMFSLQMKDLMKLEFDESLTFVPYVSDNRISKFDLSLEATEKELELVFQLEYSTKLFTKSTMERLAGHYIEILKSVTESPDIVLADIAIVTGDEKRLLLEEFNETNREYPSGKTFPELFEEQAKKTPDQVAVICEEDMLTYRTLNNMANQLARRLRIKGIQSESVVGIMVERSIDMIIGVLAVWKAGGTYLPIDPEYPDDRIQYMLEDSRAELLLSNRAIAGRVVFDKEIICFEDNGLYSEAASNLGISPAENQLAYIIYTSGTTGRPKGVMIEHASYTNVAFAWREAYQLDTFQVNLLQMASFAFDVFAGDMARALLNGGKLIICPNDVKLDPASLYELIRKYQINIFESTPALIVPLMQYIYDQGLDISQLKLLILGSDSCSAEDFANLRSRFGDGMRIVNSYGVTEACIDSSFYEHTEESLPYFGNVPIGKPLPNMKFYVLDQQLRLQPIGVPGELCIGGIGVARGYYNQPELTADKFVDNPFVPGERMYRTGDMARWMPDGNIEFLGRGDHQVKIRGYRIELGEIEASLLKHGSVKEAVVIARDDSMQQKYLCAYLVARDELTITEIRDHLSDLLPAYMIPSHFLQLDKMPLTPNGKLDRKALLALEGGMHFGSEFVAPTNVIEAKIAAVWQEVLGIDQISIHADFFQVGGHSLKAMMLISQMHKACGVEIPLRTFFQAPTIAAVAAYMIRSDEQSYAAIEPVPVSEHYPVSSAQKRMYVIHQLDETGTTYNMSDAMLVEGELDRERLTDAFRGLIRRHEALRTSFHSVDGVPVQKVHAEVPFGIEMMEANEENISVIIHELVKPFDLGQAPLMRVGLVSLSAERHLLLCDMHHIISDGISVSVLINEFAELYEGGSLPELRIQYRDFAVWQNERLQNEASKRQEVYWLDTFAGDIPVLDWPTDYTRPAMQSFEGERITFEAGEALMRQLHKLAADTGTTLYMVLLAAYNVLVAKYTGQEDVIIGSPIAGRPHADVERTIGMFVNTLAIRNFPEADKSFKQFLAEVKEVSLKSFENQDYPFEELVEKLSVRRDLSRNPLFDVLFVLQNTGDETIRTADLAFSPYGIDRNISKFDLSLEAAESDDGLSFHLEYRTALYQRATAERIAQHFLQILHVVTADSAIRLGDIDMLSAAEKMQQLHEFNQTGASFPQDQTIHGLFEAQAERTPERIAASCGDEQLTYHQLNERANSLAYVLRSHGVGPDVRVGLLAERSLDMIVGILATLKAGGAYVPLDPDYPQERTQFMLEDSGARVLLAQPHLMGKVPFDGITLDMSDSELYAGDTADLKPMSGPQDMAYIIYTSGTTGKPKGVMIEHRNVVRLLVHDRLQFDFNELDVWTVFHSFCFDFSVWEMYGALLYGGKCVVVPKTTAQNPKAFAQLLRQEGVTVLNQTPTAFYALIHEELQQPDSGLAVRYVIFGGEALNPVMLKPWKAKYPNTLLINMYGITETTVHVTYKEITDREIETNLSNIGRPIPTLTSYIFDAQRRLVPIGVVGELYVGGDGVARGYLNREELTAERFVMNPYKPEERLYRSGDLARLLPSGEMEYFGRIDHQVKIRGHRIELGEIETQLLRHERIQEATVLALDDEQGQKFLCAYFIANGVLTVSELRAYIGSDLPAYMIPSHFVKLDRIPLTANGKIDRKALPKPEGGLDSGTAYVAPRTELEAGLAQIWQDVLGCERVGVLDDFFALGGHSLKAMSLITAMHKAYEVEVPLKVLFENPIVEAIAAYIQASVKEAYVFIGRVAQEQDHYPVSSAQKRMYILSEFKGPGTGYNMPEAFMIEGSLDVIRLEAAMKELIARHEILRTSFTTVYGEPVQRVHTDIEFSIETIEVLNETELTGIAKAFIRPFELNKAPLLRAGLAKLADGRQLFLVDMHHIISDGVSIGIMMDEWVRLYQGERLPDPGIQYKDFAVWQNAWFETDAYKRQESYWLSAFAGETPVLNLPCDYVRPAVQSFEGDRVHIVVESELCRQLEQLAAQTDSTLFMLLLAAYNVLLAKYSGQQEFVVGTPIAGRSHPDTEGVLGMFVNTLALRNYVDEEMTFREFLAGVKQRALEAYTHQDYPFDRLVEQIGAARDLSRNPLFDTMFILQNISSQSHADDSSDGLKLAATAIHDGIAKFDLTFEAREVNGEIELFIDYGVKLFKKETVERIGRHFVQLLKNAVQNADIRLADMTVLNETERHQLLVAFNDTRTDLPSDKTLHGLFEEQAELTPDQPAVVCAGQMLTYAELNAKANRLARTLREQGIVPETSVGIIADRSIELVVGILAILKAGGAYVPIDPQYPQERIRYMLQDSRIQLVLSQSHLISIMSEDRYADFDGKWLDLHDERLYSSDGSNLQKVNAATDLAYIIYTSGTTGMPKGVMIEHRSITHNLLWRKGEYALDTSDTVLQLFSFAFDGFVTSFFTPIIAGATVILPLEEEAKDPLLMKKQISAHRVTHFISVPSLYTALLECMSAEEASSLRIVTLAGEKMTGTVVARSRQLHPHIELVNEYGPTENSVVATYERGLATDKEITIGRPIAGTQIYIVSGSGGLQPIGVIGELCIAGNGLARGYLNREDLTSEKFVRNPIAAAASGSGRMYRTGDLARRLPDGTIDFIGRLDEQVKVRGYRIELGEIESVILQHPLINETVVMAKEDHRGSTYLCAYIVADDVFTLDDLKVHTGKKLPAYMVPTYFVQLLAMPLTPNSKVDKHALPEPDMDLMVKKEYVAPSTAVEARLIRILQDLLEIGQIGMLDNFFDLGGHSLSAMTLVSQIYQQFQVEVPLRTVFETATIKELAAQIQETEHSRFESIKPISEQPYYPLSSAQKRLFILNMLDSGSTTYNMPGAITIEGKLDVRRFEAAFQSLADRHETLRTSFDTVDGEPVQSVQPTIEIQADYIEYAVNSLPSTDELIARFVRPFDLKTAPLFRVGLVKLEEERHLLLFDMHHLISDGVSMGIFIREFVQLYNMESLSPLRIQYKDFSTWQNRLFRSETIKTQEAYWLSRFEDEVPLLDLPTDYGRPSMRSFAGDSRAFRADKDLLKQLQQLAATSGTTLYMVLLAAFNVLLSKYANQSDIVVGTPIAGRSHADLAPVIGMFVNTLAIRSRPESSKSFRQFLAEVKEQALTAFEHQDYPFETLVEKLDLHRDLSRNPLFDTMFIMQNIGNQSIGIESLKFIPQEVPHTTSKFDLTMLAIEDHDGLELTIEFCTALFKLETMERFGRHFVRILQEIAIQPDAKLAQIDMLSVEEKKQIIVDFNQTKADYAYHCTIQELFERQAEKTPDYVAVVWDNERLTYRQLNAKANQLARVLREKGVATDCIVGVMMERSADWIVTMLAILKAGGAYLPIDIEYPAERIRYMLEDSGAQLIITQTQQDCPAEYAGEVVALAEMDLYLRNDANLGTLSTSYDLAYVIYTSGTTGKPKGIMLEHAGIANLQTYFVNQFGVTEDDRIGQFASSSFDASVWETFMALLTGASLYVLSKEIIGNYTKFEDYITDNRISILTLPPTYMTHLNPDRMSSLKKLITAGSATSFELIRRWEDKVQYYNAYGPTETTICATVWEADTSKLNVGAVPIGYPIPNTQAYIMNADNQLQPIGVPGELCIGGVGLARGYVNKPELTDEKFTDSPFVPGEHIYHTGDLARWLPDGNIEYLGRIDHQVKIRGYRIELSEIESVMQGHDLIQETIVIAREDRHGQHYLCAYFTSSSAAPVSNMREFAAGSLPDYMVPSYFIQLEQMPLTPNGKIDRKALPEPELGDIHTGVDYVAPRNELERLLAEVWEDVLGVRPIGIQDHFFELGGDSIKAIQVSTRLYKHDWKLDMKDLFQNPVIEKLSAYVQKAGRKSNQDMVIGEAALSPIQRWFFEQRFTDMHHWNQSIMLQATHGFKESVVRQVFAKIMAHHDALRTVFQVDNDRIVAHIRRLEETMVHLNVIDVRNQADEASVITEEANRLQASFDLNEGPLAKLALFKTTTGDHLLIVIHHLVIDGVSWRIILEDFALGYEQAMNGEDIVFQDKTDAYPVWTNQLQAYAASKQLLKERNYWQEIGGMSQANLLRDKKSEESKLIHTRSTAFELSGDETERLLKQVHHAYHTDVQDILLTALGLSVQEWTQQDQVIVNMEGHGREDLEGQVNVSRTVGWFTAQFPVVLDLNGLHDTGSQIKQIKEHVRRIPNKGIGFDLLRFMAPEEIRLNMAQKPEIGFNYLGQFDSDVTTKWFTISPYDMGEPMSPDAERLFTLDVTALIQGGKLSVRFAYNIQDFHQMTIMQLEQNFKKHLLEVMEHCIQKQGTELTPSDLGDHELTLEELDGLVDIFES